MIYFSYFNNPKVRKTEKKVYSVARYQYTNYPQAKELLLPHNDFSLHKNGSITKEELFIRYHFKVLVNLDLDKIKEKYNDTILCCHEVSGCHRDILKAWLVSNNIEAMEL